MLVNTKKLLIVCDHYPLSPRVKKLHSSLRNLYSDLHIEIFVWNRENNDVTEDYVISHSKKSRYGKLLTNIIKFGSFKKAVRKYIKNNTFDFIHFIDFNTLMTNIAKNKSRIIYEVYDIKFFNNKIMNFFRYLIEKKKLKNVSSIIVASPFFKNYYKTKMNFKNEVFVLENIPSLNIFNQTTNIDVFRNNLLNNKVVIGFIGTVRHKELLINLILSSVNIKEVVILIAGYGHSLNELEKFVKDNQLESKVLFTGRFSYGQIKDIYNMCDYIWAAYPWKNKNVYYAISNKYYESSLFKKPIIVSENTLLGDLVKKSNKGIVVNPYDRENIKNNLLNLINNKNEFQFEDEFIDFWEKKYDKNYYDDIYVIKREEE